MNSKFRFSIDESELPPGGVSVPMRLVDEKGERDCVLLAGCFLANIGSDGRTLVPRVDFCVGLQKEVEESNDAPQEDEWW